MKTMTNVINKTALKKMAALIAVTSMLTTVGFSSFADDGDDRDREARPRFEHSERGDHRHAKAEKRTQRLISALNLTESQIELLKLTRQPSTDNHAEMNELRKQLRDLTQSSDYSEREANKIAKQMTELTQSNIVARSNAQNAFHVSLSEEQLTTLNSLREKMKDKNKRR